jgi:hypothetical protein
MVGYHRCHGWRGIVRKRGSHGPCTSTVFPVDLDELPGVVKARAGGAGGGHDPEVVGERLDLCVDHDGVPTVQRPEVVPQEREALSCSPTRSAESTSS